MQAVSPMVQLLASGNYPVETIEKMIDLHERWEKSEAEKAFNKAMAQFRREAPVLEMDRTVDFKTNKGGRVNYKHTSLGYGMATVNPILGRNGLNLDWTPGQANGQCEVTTTLTHEMGHSKSVTLKAPPDGSGNKNPVQQIKSTMTMLERMGAFMLLGLASSYDDDGRVTQSAPEPEPMIDADDMAELLRMVKEEGKNPDLWLEHMAKTKGITDGVLHIRKRDKGLAIAQIKKSAQKKGES